MSYRPFFEAVKSNKQEVKVHLQNVRSYNFIISNDTCDHFDGCISTKFVEKKSYLSKYFCRVLNISNDSSANKCYKQPVQYTSVMSLAIGGVLIFQNAHSKKRSLESFWYSYQNNGCKVWWRSDYVWSEGQKYRFFRKKIDFSEKMRIFLKKHCFKPNISLITITSYTSCLF